MPAGWRVCEGSGIGTHRIADGAVDGFASTVLASERLEATVVTGAGMVVSSLRHDGAELLDPRGGVGRYAASGSTMGIPLLHPWANRLSGFEYVAAGRRVTLPNDPRLLHLDENGLPLHGLVPGRSRWTVEQARAGDDGAVLGARLEFSDDPAVLAVFPFPHVLRLTFTVHATTLTVTARLTPTTDTPVPVSFGFHPYLRLPDVPRDGWIVSLPVRRRLDLDARQLPTGGSQPVEIPPGPLAGRTFDDGFTDLPRPARFTLAGGGRTIAVTFVEGYPFTQVFAPPGCDFLCVEPMTAPANALVSGGRTLPVVQPGEVFKATFVIGVD